MVQQVSFPNQSSLYVQDNLVSLLVDLKDLRINIPGLAIHLEPKQENEKKLDKQKHLNPILGLINSANGKDNDPNPRMLFQMLADKTEVLPENILSAELFLYSAEPSSFGGIKKELIYGSRQDDLAMCFSAANSLLFSDDENTDSFSVAVYFDSEEIGSQNT